mgnify:CR=1 FL=1
MDISKVISDAVDNASYQTSNGMIDLEDPNHLFLVRGELKKHFDYDLIDLILEAINKGKVKSFSKAAIAMDKTIQLNVFLYWDRQMVRQHFLYLFWNLQNLLHSVADPKPKFVTARIIAGTMGSISNTFVINAGSEDGVGKGQPVLSDKGFVGRIIAVSKNSARILLATDINSRIPVILESTRTRALMVGGNTERPRLIHLPPGAQITSSERIVTSGHGGVFPPGLPVGLVASVNDVSVEVQLFTDYHLIEFVRIADFGVYGFVDLLSLKNKVGGSASKEK